MTPREFLETQKRYQEKRKLLDEIIISIGRENDRICEEFVREHSPYTQGQKVELPEGTGFFASANILTHYRSGEPNQYCIQMHFHGATKKGNKSKRIDWNLTQHIPIDDNMTKQAEA